ncbi:glutamate synthase subunit alpha, partial [Campylobacter coli]|nr:glutamate synthase subunit alpha [Campylobacter coli]
EHYANAKPYKQWLKNLVELEKQHSGVYKHKFLKEDEVLKLQKAFGWSYDELKMSVASMAQNGKEALAAMGVDTPLAILSKTYQPLYNYFKQLFAQVTNPPLDAIREEIVTSTRIYLGSEGNLLKPDENNAKRVKISLPIISNEELFEVKALNNFQVKEFSILYDYSKKTLEKALDELCVKIEDEVKKGVSIIILSDKGVDEKNAYIPALLAVSGVHNHLVRKNLRTHTSLIIESGEPREIHHFACLLGYGATVINPYLVYESIQKLIANKDLNLSYEKAVENFI